MPDEPRVRRKRSRWGTVATVLGVLLLIGAFGATLVFLYFKSRGETKAVDTDKPLVTDIVRKAVATGRIVPRREVLIKPRVSGIIKELYVKPGERVKQGALIAEIRLVPDVAALTRAEASVRSVQIALKHAAAERQRARKLFEDGLISRRELSQAEVDHDLQKAELASASEQLQVVKEGAARKGDGTTNTKVRSTVTGTVLDVPVEIGGSVIETNNFNEGTTIASVADMTDMIFLGNIDEADVGKIKKGMEVNIRIGAIDEKTFTGELEYIAPKGTEKEGAVQFQIKAAINPDEGVAVRAGYSANAEIVLAKKSQVLAINESLLRFDGKAPYVDVEVSPGQFERRDVELGISDGIHIEVLSGVEADTIIRQPTPSPTQTQS
jgi:HlyD family secretion protein